MCYVYILLWKWWLFFKSAAKEWTRLYASGAWQFGGYFWSQITIVEVYAINYQIEMEKFRGIV